MNEGILITAERIVQFAAVLGALAVLVTYLIKFISWLFKQKKQDAEIRLSAPLECLGKTKTGNGDVSPDIQTETRMKKIKAVFFIR